MAIINQEKIININKLTNLEFRKKLYGSEELTDEQVTGELNYDCWIYGLNMVDDSLETFINSRPSELKNINSSIWVVSDKMGNMGVIFIPHFDFPQFAEVIIPLSKTKFGHMWSVITANPKDNKVGVFDVKSRTFLLEGYDDLEYANTQKKPGYLLHKDGKVGFASLMSNAFPNEWDYYSSVFCEDWDYAKSEDKDYLKHIDKNVNDVRIPVEYDEIVPVKETSGEHVFLVKEDGLWGAYCFYKYKRRHWMPERDDTIEYNHLAKIIIPPIFEKVDVVRIHENWVGKKNDIIAKVWLNGKEGLINPYNCSIVVPLAFDEIISYDNEKNITKGIIDGKLCLYDGESFLVTTKINPSYEDIPVKVLKK